MKIFDEFQEKWDWTWRDLLLYFSHKQSWKLCEKSWRLDTNQNSIKVLYTNHIVYRYEFRDYPIMEIIRNNSKCIVRFRSEDDEVSNIYYFKFGDNIIDSLEEVPFNYRQKANLFLSTIRILELDEGD